MSKRITKKLTAARLAFQAQVKAALIERGATYYNGWYDWILTTLVGDLYISIHEWYIHCRFNITPEALAINGNLSRYDGKWNHHFGDDAESLDSCPEQHFLRTLDRILAMERPPCTPRQAEAWWKHSTTASVFKTRAGIDLFDDEQPGFTTIYIRYDDGTRCSARSVDMSDAVHADTCLRAWCAGQSVNDFRAPLTAEQLATA